MISPWNDEMSDGCSVPPALRRMGWLLPSETAEQRSACVLHDRDYYYGGTQQMRRDADEMFRIRLVNAGMSKWRARMYWIAVRVFGGPGLHRVTTWMIGRPQAWGYGGGVFAYTLNAAGE